MYLLEYTLIILPAIVLLVFIYKMETLKKEPKFLLLVCFCLGMLATPLSGVLNFILELIFNLIVDIDMHSIAYTLVEYIFFVGFCEEFCKYLILRKITWNSKSFNYLFSGIVFAVFVSLGFATLENFEKVGISGLDTALSRLYTAVPAHACFAVFMGYFYSKSKEAALLGKMKKSREFTRCAIFAPMLMHGFYDASLAISRKTYFTSESTYTVLHIIWHVAVILMIAITFLFVLKCARNNHKFPEVQTGPTKTDLKPASPNE